MPFLFSSHNSYCSLLLLFLPLSVRRTRTTMTGTLKLFELVDSRTRTISFSPAVWRAKYALRHKSLPYESVLLTFLEIPVEIPEAW